MTAHELARALLAGPDVPVVGAHFDGDRVGDVFAPEEHLDTFDNTVVVLWCDDPDRTIQPPPEEYVEDDDPRHEETPILQEPDFGRRIIQEDDDVKMTLLKSIYVVDDKAADLVDDMLQNSDMAGMLDWDVTWDRIKEEE